MFVYIFGTIFSIIFSITAFNSEKPFEKKNKYQKISCVLSALPLILIAGLRYNVGQDYDYTYKPYFNGMLYNVVNKNIEVGFYALTKFIQMFTNDYVWLFIVCAVIYGYFIFASIYEQSPNPALSIFLLVSTQYYFGFLNTMRQYMAIAIFLYAIKYIKKRKIWKYLFLIIIASTLHTSAIVFIPVYFLYNIKITPKNGIVIFTIAIALSTVIKNILMTILLKTKYFGYLGSEFDTGEKGIISMLIEIIILIFAWMFYSTKGTSEEKQKNYNFYCNLKLISVILACLDGILPLVYRIKWCFGLSTIILIPLILERVKNKKYKFFYQLAIVSCFLIYIFYTVGIQNSNNVLPYNTIFSR